MMVGAFLANVFPNGSTHAANSTDPSALPVVDFHGYQVTPLELTSALSLGVGVFQVSNKRGNTCVKDSPPHPKCGSVSGFPYTP